MTLEVLLSWAPPYLLSQGLTDLEWNSTIFGWIASSTQVGVCCLHLASVGVTAACPHPYFIWVLRNQIYAYVADTLSTEPSFQPRHSPYPLPM